MSAANGESSSAQERMLGAVLPNDDVVEAVATGRDGILAGLDEGKV
jgi:hypothetical protein